MSDIIGKRIAKKTWNCATYANDKIKISIATGKIEIFINCENGQHATTNHTPAQAREIAAELIRLAAEIEGKAMTTATTSRVSTKTHPDPTSSNTNHE